MTNPQLSSSGDETLHLEENEDSSNESRISKNGLSNKEIGDSNFKDENSLSLKTEISALQWLLKRKEKEWNAILRLLKIKEEKYEKLCRTERLNAVLGSETALRLSKRSISKHSTEPPAPKSKKGKMAPTCQSCTAKISQFVCAGCSRRWYCSRLCQISDWNSHADHCTVPEEH